MIEYSRKRNMLMECEYQYKLQDVANPNLYSEMFPYTEVPKCTFNQRVSPIDPPDEIWITDTTFRDGQQSRDAVYDGTGLYVFIRCCIGWEGRRV